MDVNNIELIKLLLSAVSPILILLGWYFIRLNTHKFAVRAEMNAVAKEIIVITGEMLNISIEYWLKTDANSKHSNFSYQLLTLNHFNRLIQKKTILENYNQNFKLLKIKKLKQELTLNSRTADIQKNNQHFSQIIDVITTVNNQVDTFIATEKTSIFEQFINLYPIKTGQILAGILCIIYLTMFSYLY